MKRIILASLLLCSCNSPKEIADRRRAHDVDDATRNGHFFKVGQTPSGAPILMTQVDIGYSTDHVYLIGNTISANENCGKACTHSIVTKEMK